MVKKGEMARAPGSMLGAMRSPMSEPVVFPSEVSLFFGSVDPHATTPNKSPEPTPTAVTPRAIEWVVEMKQMNRSRFVARGAPAAVVAHL
jgi:hypothetical protein